MSAGSFDFAADMETAVETARLLPEAFLIEVRPVVSG